MSSRDIVITDLDGCLTDYPRVFLSWISEVKGLSFDSLEALKASMSHDDYEDLKHSYRISGVKRRLPLFPDAKETLEGLKRNGVDIWIVTRRPRWEPVVSDTKYWLNANYLPYDELFFVSNKQAWIRQSPEKERIRVVIDDELAVLEFASNNLDVSTLYLNDKRQTVVTNDRIVVVSNWKEIQDYLRGNRLL